MVKPSFNKQIGLKYVWTTCLFLFSYAKEILQLKSAKISRHWGSSERSSKPASVNQALISGCVYAQGLQMYDKSGRKM